MVVVIESGWRRDLNLLLTKRLFASQCRSSFFNLEYQSCLWCKQTYDGFGSVRVCVLRVRLIDLPKNKRY